MWLTLGSRYLSVFRERFKTFGIRIRVIPLKSFQTLLERIFRPN